MKHILVLLCLLWCFPAMAQEVAREYKKANRPLERLDPMIETYKKSGLYNSHQQMSARVEAMVIRNDQKGLKSFFEQNKKFMGSYDETLEQVKETWEFFKTSVPGDMDIQVRREGETGKTMCIFPYVYTGESEEMKDYFYSIYVVFTWQKNETQELSVSLVKMPVMEYEYVKDDRSSIRTWRRVDRRQGVVDDFIEKK